MRIDVTERDAVAVVDAGSALRGLDADGRAVPPLPDPAARPAAGPDRPGHARADALAEAARVAGSLPRAIAGKVDYVEVRTVDTISLRLRNGRTVLWGSADDSDRQGPGARRAAATSKASTYDVTRAGPADITKYRRRRSPDIGCVA